MKNSDKRYTRGEELVIIRCIAKHTYNLRRGFREAAEILERTEGGVSGHWYQKLSKDRSEVNRVFATISRNQGLLNRKIGEPVPIKVPLWRKLFYQITKMIPWKK